jgi:ribosomal protein L6P/L9E
MLIEKLDNQVFSYEPRNLAVGLFYYKNHKYLIRQNASIQKVDHSTILKIPFYLLVKKKKNFFSFHNNLRFLSEQVLGFQNFLITSNKSLNKTFKKKLILKGLGMRVKYVEINNSLQLKLGFSYLVNVSVPEGLKIFIHKNLLIIEGVNGAQVGNFTNLIRSLKYPNAYNGKGFWLKYETISLKEVKKT